MEIELENRSTVDWVILADYAEVVNHKLYLMGGGWDVIVAGQGFPVQRVVGIGIAVRVPWNETNDLHQLELEVQDEDATAVLAKIDGQFEMGRPPGIPRGQTQRFQMAVNVPIQFDQPGTYAVVVRIDGRDEGRTPFSVVSPAGRS